MNSDEFQVQLARIAMLPPNLVEAEVVQHLGKSMADFNKAMAMGVQPLGSQVQVRNSRLKFDLKVIAAKNNSVSAVCLYVRKQPFCNCGETPDSLYIAFAPVTNPAYWKLYVKDGGTDPDTNLHKGLFTLSSDISVLLVKYIHEIRDKRFLADADGPAAALVFQPSTWPLPVYITGYGFGGALAQIVAVQFQRLSTDIQLHLTTFGAPAVVREGVVGSKITIRRFAHARDPITRLMDGFEHMGVALEDEDTQVDVDASRFGSKGNRAEACRDMGCHTAYLGVDFRTKPLMDFYAGMPPGIAVTMLPNVKGANELWTFAYKQSSMLTAEGNIPCAWSMSLDSPPGSPRP